MKKTLIYIALCILTVLFCIEIIYTNNWIIKTLNLMIVMINTIILTTDFDVIRVIMND